MITDPSVGLRSIAHVLPERRVTSDELAEAFVDARGEQIMSGRILSRLTGVRERRYADAGTCSSDLAAAAATTALNRAGILPTDIDLVIFAAASHDISEPATANRVQELTGCSRARVMDVKNACNSFLDAMDVARALIRTGVCKRVLIATGEVISLFVEMTVREGVDASELVAGLTLGDAGAAAVVEEMGPKSIGRIENGAFLTLGQHWSASRLLGGGSMHGRDYSDNYFMSNSRLLFSLATEHVPVVVGRVMAEQGWASGDVDLVVPHQASTQIVRNICHSTGLDIEKCTITGDFLGNTAAASIPVALSLAIEAGRLDGAERILLVGGAAGFSAAAIPLVVEPS